MGEARNIQSMRVQGEVEMSRSSAQPMRLTRRGRAVVKALIIIPVLVLLLWAGLQGVQAFGSDEQNTGHLPYMTVSQGETLWNIATTVAPDQDPRDVIADIQRINRLGTAPLQAGEQLALPEYAATAQLAANVK